MLVIRLQRVGKKKQAFFRLALQEKEWAPQGKAIELLGFYNPHNKEETTLNTERLEHWIGKGAQPSPTVHNMLVDAGIIEGDKVQAWKPKKKDAEEAPKEDDADNKESPPAEEADQPEDESDTSADEGAEPEESDKEEDKDDNKESEEVAGDDKGGEDKDGAPQEDQPENKTDSKELESSDDKESVEEDDDPEESTDVDNGTGEPPSPDQSAGTDDKKESKE